MTAARRRWQLLLWMAACSASSRPWKTAKSAVQQRRAAPLSRPAAKVQSLDRHRGSCRGPGHRAASAAHCCASTMVRLPSPNLKTVQQWHCQTRLLCWGMST